MILEYVVQSALADMRRQAAPASLATAVLSSGAEEHATFSPQAARGMTDALRAYRTVLACELVAVARALRLRGRVPATPRLRALFDLACGALNAETLDRPLDGDVEIATALLPRFADGGPLA